MQRFLVRRFFITILTLLAISAIIFALARAAGDPRTLLLSRQAEVADWDALGEKLGLNKSYIHQYGIFMKDLVQGDFGDSIAEGRPVIDVVGERIRPTIELGLAALLWSTMVGVPLGILGAVRRDGIFDRIGKVIALIGQSAPNFWIGIMLIFLLCREVRMVAAFRPGGPTVDCSSRHHLGVVVRSCEHEADPFGHARRAGLGVH